MSNDTGLGNNPREPKSASQAGQDAKLMDLLRQLADNTANLNELKATAAEILSQRQAAVQNLDSFGFTAAQLRDEVRGNKDELGRIHQAIGEEKETKLKEQQDHYTNPRQRVENATANKSEAEPDRAAVAEEQEQKAEVRIGETPKAAEFPDEKEIAKEVQRIVAQDYSFIAKRELEPGVPLIAQFSKRDLRDWLGFADKHTDKIFRPAETQLKDEKIRLEALGKTDPDYRVKKAELERKAAALVRQKEAEKRSLFGDSLVTPDRVPGKWSDRLNIAAGMATNLGMLGSVYMISQGTAPANAQGVFCALTALVGAAVMQRLKRWGDDGAENALDFTYKALLTSSFSWGNKLSKTAELYQLVDHYHRKMLFTDSLSAGSTASVWSLYNRTVGRVAGFAIRLYKRTLGHVVAPLIQKCTFGWLAPSNTITGMEGLRDLSKNKFSVLFVKERLLEAGRFAAEGHAYQERTGKRQELSVARFNLSISAIDEQIKALRERSAVLSVCNMAIGHTLVAGTGILAASGIFSGTPVTEFTTPVAEFISQIMNTIRNFR